MYLGKRKNLPIGTMKTFRWFHRPSSILPQLRILIAGTLFVLAAAMLANAFEKGPTAITPLTPWPASDHTTQLGPTKAQGRVPPPPAEPSDFYRGEPLSNQTFYVHDLGHRCLDFGNQDAWKLSAPVFIYSCNGTVAQQVHVKEIDASHDVELRVQSPRVGEGRRVYCIGVRGGQVVVGEPLELQDCNKSPAQRFALDGDSILMGKQIDGRVTREFAIEPDHKRTPNRTPLVVADREVSDAEYFRFERVNDPGARPTSGFVRVSDEAQLDEALKLGWGTVIEIDPAQQLELKGPFRKGIHAGVTLRGYRKYIFQGPEIHTCTRTDDAIFDITEDNVRITGLRLRGPVDDPRCRSSNVSAQAILIEPERRADGNFVEGAHVPIVLVDHLDIGYFTASGVDTRGTESHASCPSPRDHRSREFPRSTPVRVIGNFIHHTTERAPWDQYGSVAGSGAFILNQGNVFYLQHAHHIAADSSGTTGYHAYDNFFLSNQRKTHDVDMHGSGQAEESHWQGGVSGDYFDVGWNTFLHTGANNINQRGTPCRFTAIHDNIFLQSKGAAIVTATTDLTKHVVWGNSFNAPNPTADLAVGDFDGDGIDDVFVGTGAAWYFSSGGQAEWRFLNRMSEHASALRFGDFDGDRRTDVMALHGAHVDISWGGLSPWQTVNVVAWPITNIAVGDFDGDKRADLFLATGSQWFFAPGGRNWTPFGFSQVQTKDLRFGDFTHEGRTELLRISRDRQWQLVRHIGGSWESLGSAGNTDLASLVVGDFDGDGFDDVGRDHTSILWGPHYWEYTSPGRTTGWTYLRGADRLLTKQPIGRFDADATSDVIVWIGRGFDYAPGAKGPLVRLSRQDMK
jgi:hypothetical protein